MEVDWAQRQIEGYARDSMRALYRLQHEEEDRQLIRCALDLLRTYVAIPSQMPACADANQRMAELAQILYVYLHAYGYWQEIFLLWPQMLVLAHTHPDPAIFVQITKQLAVIKNDLGLPQEAQTLYNGLIARASFTELPLAVQADILHQASVCHYRQGDYSRARQCILTCIALAYEDAPAKPATNRHTLLRVHSPAPPLWESKAYAFNQLGYIALAQGNCAGAARHFGQSLNCLVANGEAENLACVAYQSLGCLFLLRRRFAEATDKLEHNLTIRRRRGEALASEVAKVYLAAAYLGLHRLAVAETLLAEALSALRAVQNERGLALCYLYLGYLERARNDWRTATATWLRAHAYAKAIPMIELQVLAALLTATLRIGAWRRAGRILVNMLTNVRRQRLSALQAVQLLTLYLRW